MAKKDKLMLGPPYPSPPIFECVMELRFRDAPRADFAAKAARKIDAFYDHAKTDHLVNIEVVVVEGAANTTSSTPVPVIKLTSNDQTDSCTISSDKMYWSKLAPYKGWDEFCGRIMRDLASLRRVVGQRPLTRIGLRYRNRIDIPVEQPERICHFEKFLKIKIDLPDLLDPISAFAWRIDKVFPDLGLSAMVTSGVMDSVLPNMDAFLLDIDISSQLTESVNRTDLKVLLEKMRRLKNDIFERSITDLARESFR